MVINHIKGIGQSVANSVYTLYPDQYVSEEEKAGERWIKINGDYFANVAYAQFMANERTLTKNYKLLKGILTREDFYEEEQVASFTETLLKDNDLPSHVKHYPILNPPINTMIGELSRRPDDHHVKAYDDDSLSEEMANKTDVLQNFILQKVRKEVLIKIAQKQGISPQDILSSQQGQQQVEEMTAQQVADYMTGYTSTAEKWGNMTLEALKMELNLKELSEDAFRDLLTCSREYFQILEDNSKLGFRVVNPNPKKVWKLIAPDKKYTRDAYAIGTLDIMELSEILDIFDLDMEEIEALRKGMEGYETNLARESNVFGSATGDKTVTYDVYDPLVQRERMLAESQVQENTEILNNFIGIGNNVHSFGAKFVVVRAYVKSKKKTGLLTYLDPDTGRPEKTLVDETYKKIPEEISIEWGYQNQWWEIIKIGKNVYKAKPYTLLDYPPIIGVIHENRNTEARSLVDLMKPFQVLYNICMNQLFSLFEKELGNVANVSLRRIPRLKDSDDQDAIDQWEMMAKEKGITFDDDSPENTKVPVSNQTVARNIDLTRTNEIQSRYNAAVQLKNECWELVGFNRQRLGSVLATETATGTNTALNQSYAQTEPYFTQHEYVLNQFYQALLDASQSIESQKPTSTLSYINSEGNDAFIQVNGNELKFKDLKVFVTSRAEDQRMFNELKQLAQPILQNGGTPYDIAVLYTTNSIRQMKDTFKKLKEQQEQLQQQQMQQKQQELDQQQKQFEDTQNLAIQQHNQDRADDDYQKELDRINKKEIEIIRTFSGKNTDNERDDNANGVPDILEYSRLSSDIDQAEKSHQRDLAKLAMESKKQSDAMNIELKKLRLEKDKLKTQKEMQDKQIAADITVAKYRDKGTKNSPKKKK